MWFMLILIIMRDGFSMPGLRDEILPGGSLRSLYRTPTNNNTFQSGYQTDNA
jgi:hypothetical protein